jgi:hypothetical protein
MIDAVDARQPVRVAWSPEKLFRKRAFAMEHALDKSSKKSYASALNSYLNFCEIHNLPIDPTPDTLSFYITFLCDHIEPRSVRNYLSGICSSLESFFPYVRESRKHVFVTRTLKGCLRIYSRPTHRKEPLGLEHLSLAMNSIPHPATHDDLLWVTQLLTGFRGLLRLGELTRPDTYALRDWKKLSLCNSLELAALPFGCQGIRWTEASKAPGSSSPGALKLMCFRGCADIYAAVTGSSLRNATSG